MLWVMSPNLEIVRSIALFQFGFWFNFCESNKAGQHEAEFVWNLLSNLLQQNSILNIYI